MTERNGQDAAERGIIKIAFGVMALICLLTGLLLYLFAESLGLDPETAQFVAIAFLVVGVGDYVALRLWDHIMKRKESD